MVHFAQVGQFVRDNIIDKLRGEVDQSPIQADAAFQAATAPARARCRQGQWRRGDAEQLGVMGEAFGK